MLKIPLRKLRLLTEDDLDYRHLHRTCHGCKFWRREEKNKYKDGQLWEQEIHFICGLRGKELDSLYGDCNGFRPRTGRQCSQDYKIEQEWLHKKEERIAEQQELLLQDL